MIAGLESLSELWRETFQRIEFQKPSTAFVGRLTGNIALPIGQHHLDSTLTFALGGALQLILMDEDPDAAQRLLNAMTTHSERIAAEVIADSGDPVLFGTEALVWLAAARTMTNASAPDRTLLLLAAESTIARLGALGKRKNIHAAGLARLQYAAYAALLSGDLELFRRALSVRAMIAIYPKKWALLQTIAKRSQQSECGGCPVIRCNDAEVHAAFMAMFQLHRQPTNRHVEATLGNEGLLAGGQLGGYIHAWIYLQTFAPSPVLQSDWAVLRELLIG